MNRASEICTVPASLPIHTQWGVPEGAEKERKAGKIVEEIMSANISSFMKKH